MNPILGAADRGVNSRVHPLMDDILQRFCATGRCGEPEPLRPRAGSTAAAARQAVQVHEARKADPTPLDRAADWLLAELPALGDHDTARRIVGLTVARIGAGETPTPLEALIDNVWYQFVTIAREEARAARLGGSRG